MSSASPKQQHPSVIHRNQNKHLMMSELTISLKKKKYKNPEFLQLLLHAHTHVTARKQQVCPLLLDHNSKMEGTMTKTFKERSFQI